MHAVSSQPLCTLSAATASRSLTDHAGTMSASARSSRIVASKSPHARTLSTYAASARVSRTRTRTFALAAGAGAGAGACAESVRASAATSESMARRYPGLASRGQCPCALLAPCSAGLAPAFRQARLTARTRAVDTFDTHENFLVVVVALFLLRLGARSLVVRGARRWSRWAWLRGRRARRRSARCVRHQRRCAHRER